MRARGRGFGLIELMVTVAIVALLALVALPFSARWMESDRELQARGELMEALAHARSLALRNAEGLPPGVPVTCLRVVAGPVLELTKLTAGQVCPTAGTVAWRATLHPRLTLREAGTKAPFKCVAFDSRAAAVQGAQASTCTLAPKLQVLGGSSQEALDVDLL
jgi:prepilin-type N-terminal cleavage/methylation domain-containing protein